MNYAKVSQYNLGVFFALAKSVDKDIEKSKYWIKKAHENGYSIPQWSANKSRSGISIF